MRVLVACEFSGIVRDAFTRRGHDAVSCDLLDTERPNGIHVMANVLDVIRYNKFDLMIAHPPCTYLAISGSRWWMFKGVEQRAALQFVLELMHAPITRIAIENPVSTISRQIYPPSQIIQPWQFGHPETKATCLWLQGLAPLVPTNIVNGRVTRIHSMGPSPNRSRERSRTYEGIAEAMADQWT